MQTDESLRLSHSVFLRVNGKYGVREAGGNCFASFYGRPDAERLALDYAVWMSGKPERVFEQTVAFAHERDAARAERDHARKQLESVTARMNAMEAESAQQYPAGTVWFVPTGEVRPPKKGEWFMDNSSGWFKRAHINYIESCPIYRHCESPPQAMPIGTMPDGFTPKGAFAWSSSGERVDFVPVAERDALKAEVERLKGELELREGLGREIGQAVLEKLAAAPEPQRTEEAGEYPNEVCIQRMPKGTRLNELYRVVSRRQQLGEFYSEADAREWMQFKAGQSPVHKELEEARKEIERLKGELHKCSGPFGPVPLSLARANAEVDSLRELVASFRKDREAWEAVRKYGVWLNRYTHEERQWSAETCDDNETELFSDPRDAVLALAKELEGGK